MNCNHKELFCTAQDPDSPAPFSACMRAWKLCELCKVDRVQVFGVLGLCGEVEVGLVRDVPSLQTALVDAVFSLRRCPNVHLQCPGLELEWIVVEERIKIAQPRRHHGSELSPA